MAFLGPFLVFCSVLFGGALSVSARRRTTPIRPSDPWTDPPGPRPGTPVPRFDGVDWAAQARSAHRQASAQAIRSIATQVAAGEIEAVSLGAGYWQFQKAKGR